MKHGDDGDTNCSWCTWNGPQGLGKMIGTIENQKKNRDHRNFDIVKIGENTEKSPGDLRTPTSVKANQITLLQKLARREIIIITKIAGKDKLLYVHGSYQDIRQKWKKQETLIQTVRKYSQDIGMEFGIDKRAILITKSGKRGMTERIEPQNQELEKMKIRSTWE